MKAFFLGRALPYNFWWVSLQNIRSGGLETTNKTSLKSVFHVEHVSELCFCPKRFERVQNFGFLWQHRFAPSSCWLHLNLLVWLLAQQTSSFGDFATVWQKNKVQKRVLREKLTLETFCFEFWDGTARGFDLKLTKGCKEQNVAIRRDLGSMLGECTLKSPSI